MRLQLPVNKRNSFSQASQAILLALGVLWSFPTVAAYGGEDSPTKPPSFRREVMAVLSKAGCNLGACHGNQNGKGGFKLSLRGQDPDFDFQSIVRGYHGRRIDRIAPGQSLLLKKPLQDVPHQGGRRFEHDSKLAGILTRWIEAGAQISPTDTKTLVDLKVSPTAAVLTAPTDHVQIKATAVYSDGSKQDVSDLAVYETSNLNVVVSPKGQVKRKKMGEVTVVVRFLSIQVPVELAFIPERKSFTWSAPAPVNYVDKHVHARLQKLRMRPSEQADDSTLFRRLHLDLIGVPPTAADAKAYLNDRRLDKFSRTVDRLLASQAFADYWTLKWSDILRNEEKVLDATGVDRYHSFIRTAISQGTPLDHFVRQILISRGSTYENPASNFYRANRDPSTRAETTARLFLGVRLQCAKCHNHPFDKWTQDDYYNWAALFARIDYEIVDNNRRDRFDKNEFVGEQIVVIRDSGELKNARTGRNAVPQPLGESLKKKPSVDRLAVMANWVTTNNSTFDQVMANFVWYHLMGRGLVEPIDDFRLTNPPSNAPLIKELAFDLVTNRYDMRHLIRQIVSSRTYQTSAIPNATNKDDQRNFSRAVVKRLTAEQLLDSQSKALDVPAEFAGYPPGTTAIAIPGVRRVRRRGSEIPNGDRFLAVFGKPERLLACECERSNETTLSQSFLYLSGKGLNDRLKSKEGFIYKLSDSGDFKLGVEALFWRCLSRSPTNEESAQAKAHIQYCLNQHGNSRQARFEAYQDIAWSLLNAKEAIFRH